MNKKSVLIIFFIIFTTGCSTNYNINFNDETITEEIKIGLIDQKYEETVSLYEPKAIDDNYYDFDYSNNYLNLKYKYTINQYRISNLINECYDLVGITYDDDYYYINTSDEFKCITYDGYPNDNVTINFETNHDIEETNADKIVNKVYIWNINKNNYTNKPISIKLKKDINKGKKSNGNSSNNSQSNSNTFIDNTPIFIITSIIVITIGIIVFIISRISKKRNEL